jgi:hypothetical protein
MDNPSRRTFARAAGVAHSTRRNWGGSLLADRSLVWWCVGGGEIKNRAVIQSSLRANLGPPLRLREASDESKPAIWLTPPLIQINNIGYKQRHDSWQM